jgi:5'(3')-deoxyribonucleotidase
MKRSQVRIICGDKNIMYRAFDLLLEDGIKKAEKYLTDKGLMNNDERLYSVNQVIEHEDDRFVCFNATPISFGVVKI